MATKSVFKNVVVESLDGVEALLKALEDSVGNCGGIEGGLEIFHEVSGEEIGEMFFSEGIRN